MVGYSDSEGSEDEKIKVARPVATTAKSVSAGKASIQPLVDASNPHRIRVSFPQPSKGSGIATDAQDDLEKPPAKRAKTGGAFSGFNSLLPAPKKAAMVGIGQDKMSIGIGRARGAGLGVGISLKTGAAPAFSRQSAPEIEYQEGIEAEEEQENIRNTIPLAGVAVISAETRPQAKTTMFRPLSVNRKPQKKKKVPSQNDNSSSAAGASEGMEGSLDFKNIGTNRDVVQQPGTKIKKSLFATADATPEDGPEATDDDLAEEAVAHWDHLQTNNETNRSATIETPNVSGSGSASLQTLADQLGLTAAQRRQLFGRGGNPTAAQIQQFSLAAEYQHNNKLMQDQNTAPAHNPVRSIAPGKHSLQQLMNAATNQKDALEESFASGKKNKKDAGSRYGW